MGLLNKILKKEEKPQAPQTVKVLMQDGTIETYPKAFRIEDGVNCVICRGEYYHTNLDCDFLDREIGDLKAMYVKDAEKKGISKCFKCKEMDES